MERYGFNCDWRFSPIKALRDLKSEPFHPGAEGSTKEFIIYVSRIEYLSCHTYTSITNIVFEACFLEKLFIRERQTQRYTYNRLSNASHRAPC